MSENNNENKNWISEFELRQFTDMATRWSIESIYSTKSDKRPFGMFDYYVENAPLNYDKFCNQLNEKLTNATNWNAIEIDLKDRFIPTIDHYLKWYEQNKIELEKFNPYNPYAIMQIVMERTKKEILKYFPDKPLQVEHEPLDLSDSSGVEKIIYLNELGIIDLIRSNAKAGISNGGLASILSAITGINAQTIKPSLNRLDKKETIFDTRHPYYKAENVDKIKKRIAELGL
jgi:hypothetical protein